MAVRNFDVTTARSAVVVPLAPPARPRRERRRIRQRWLALSALALTVPFAAALIVLGVAH